MADQLREPAAESPRRPRLLPELWKLADVAAELRMHTHSLVEASRRGEFVKVTKVGKTWFARAIDVLAWFEKSNDRSVSELMRDRIRAAGAAPDGARPPRRQRQPRARSGASC